MKNLFKGAVLTAAAAFAFTACNKDQRVVNRLEGDWKVTSVKFYVNNVIDNSFTLDPNETILLTFDDCKLKSDDWCNVVTKSTSNGQTQTENGIYQVTDDGEKIILDDDGSITSTDDRVTANITESSKKSFKFSWSEMDGSDTYKYEYELTAQ